MLTFKYFHIPKTLSHYYCEKALKALERVVKKPQQGIIQLIAIESEEMAQMNEQFRGKKGSTDILTFSYYSPELKKTDIVGEIYLCLEKIKLYAKERGMTYKEQLEYIVIHGLVHLMGYDHESEKDAREMEKVERKIQSAI